MLNRTVLFLALTMISLAAYGHHPWVWPESATIDSGESVGFVVFFGHEFPRADPLRSERIGPVRLLAPDGQVVDIDHAAGLNTGPLNQPGVYRLGVEQTRGYWTRTTEGGQARSREQLANAVHCNYSGNSATTLIRVGDSTDSAWSTPLGHRLEILLLSDPPELGPDQDIQLRLIFDDQPHAGPVMVFNADSGEDPVLAMESDENGQAGFTLPGAGPWLIKAVAEIDYPDPGVCDVERFIATLAIPAIAEQTR